MTRIAQPVTRVLTESSSSTSRVDVTVEEVCKMLRTPDPRPLEPVIKTSPRWKKVIGYIAYLLERDGRLSAPGISRSLKCDTDLVAEQIRDVTAKVVNADPETIRRLADLRTSIAARVSEPPSSLTDEDVPAGETKPPPKKCVITVEAIKAAVCKASGLSNLVLQGREIALPAVWARDMVFFYAVVRLRMRNEDAGRLLGRSPMDVRNSLRRMRYPDPERRKLLVAVGEELGLKEEDISSLRERLLEKQTS